MKRIKRDDNVVVIAGKSKGHVGKVLKVIDDKVIVEGANLVKKHVKPNPQINEPGGIKEREASIHVSNVAHLDPQTNKPTKIGFKFIEENGVKRKVRYLKSNEEVIDI